jgi:YggT family protein
MRGGNDVVTQLICFALFVAWLILLVRVIVSWIQFFGWRPPLGGPLRAGYDAVIAVTEPPLQLLRRIVPPAGPLDLSVVVAFVVLLVLRIVFC